MTFKSLCFVFYAQYASRNTHDGQRGYILQDDLVFGRNIVNEVLKSGRRRVKEIYLSSSVNKSEVILQIQKKAKLKKISVKIVTKQFLDKVTHGGLHQGVAARASELEFYSLDEVLVNLEKTEEVPFFLVLNNINDPQNVGALLRTAEVCNVSGVIVPHRHFPKINSTVVKASAGASEYVPVIKEHNLALCLEKLKKRNIWIFGAEAEGSMEYSEADFSLPAAIVLGSEGEGLKHLIKQKCDFLIKVPMFGKINSLNVSVTGALLMFEVLRKRKKVI